MGISLDHFWQIASTHHVRAGDTTLDAHGLSRVRVTHQMPQAIADNVVLSYQSMSSSPEE